MASRRSDPRDFPTLAEASARGGRRGASPPRGGSREGDGWGGGDRDEGRGGARGGGDNFRGGGGRGDAGGGRYGGGDARQSRGDGRYGGGDRGGDARQSRGDDRYGGDSRGGGGGDRGYDRGGAFGGGRGGGGGDRYGSGGGYGGGGDRGRGGGGGGGPRRDAGDIVARREGGLVIAMKENFGFIKSAARMDDLYFSYSEVSVPRGEAPPPLANGDEVEFDVLSRGGRLAAVAVDVVPRGSVKFTLTLGKRRGGVVVSIARGARRGKAAAAGRGGGVAEVRTGLIHVTGSEAAALAPPGAPKVVAPPPAPAAPAPALKAARSWADEVEADEAAGPPPPPRAWGAGGGAGGAAAAGAPAAAAAAAMDADDDSDNCPAGSLLEYGTDDLSARGTALWVGDVVAFDEELERRTELRFAVALTRLRSPFLDRIDAAIADGSLAPSQGAVESLGGGWARVRPVDGDELVAVPLEQVAAAAAAAAPAAGAPPARAPALEVGDALEFYAALEPAEEPLGEGAPPPRAPARVGLRARLLPRGSMRTEEVLHECVLGVVRTELVTEAVPPAAAAGAQRPVPRVSGTGEIELVGGGVVFPFTAGGVAGGPRAAALLREGDIVRCHVSRPLRGGAAPAASAIALLAPAPGHRELGRVSGAREGFGFIKVPGRDADVFFHFSACVGAPPQLPSPPPSGAELVAVPCLFAAGGGDGGGAVPRVGDEVSFDTEWDPRKRAVGAVRVHVVPKGSVAIEAVLARRVEGVISRITGVAGRGGGGASQVYIAAFTPAGAAAVAAAAAASGEGGDAPRNELVVALRTFKRCGGAELLLPPRLRPVDESYVRATAAAAGMSVEAVPSVARDAEPTLRVCRPRGGATATAAAAAVPAAAAPAAAAAVLPPPPPVPVELRFEHRDVADPRTPLGVGDTVRFTVMRHRAHLLLRAVDVELVSRAAPTPAAAPAAAAAAAASGAAAAGREPARGTPPPPAAARSPGDGYRISAVALNAIVRAEAAGAAARAGPPEARTGVVVTPVPVAGGGGGGIGARRGLGGGGAGTLQPDGAGEAPVPYEFSAIDRVPAGPHAARKAPASGGAAAAGEEAEGAAADDDAIATLVTPVLLAGDRVAFQLIPGVAAAAPRGGGRGGGGARGGGGSGGRRGVHVRLTCAGAPRLTGVVASLKGDFGFLKPVEAPGDESSPKDGSPIAAPAAAAASAAGAAAPPAAVASQSGGGGSGGGGGGGGGGAAAAPSGEVFFHMSEVVASLDDVTHAARSAEARPAAAPAVRVGDLVEYSMSVLKRPAAVRVVPMEKGSRIVTTDEMGAVRLLRRTVLNADMKRDAHSPMGISTMSRAPDGTKGFSAGRGKALAPPPPV